MVSFYIFHLLSVLLSSLGVVFGHVDSCKLDKCMKDGPAIRFPFRIKERQPAHCGYLGFDLSCQDENTLIHIPSMNRDLVVEYIDYTGQTITLAPKPKDCIWRPFLNNPNLSVSPFLFYRSSYSTLISCSNKVEFGSADLISCLSDWEHNVFALEADAPVGSMPVSCQPLKTILTPQLRDEYGDTEPFHRIYLRWDVPRCKDYHDEGI